MIPLRGPDGNHRQPIAVLAASFAAQLNVAVCELTQRLMRGTATMDELNMFYAHLAAHSSAAPPVMSRRFAAFLRTWLSLFLESHDCLRHEKQQIFVEMYNINCRADPEIIGFVDAVALVGASAKKRSPKTVESIHPDVAAMFNDVDNAVRANILAAKRSLREKQEARQLAKITRKDKKLREDRAHNAQVLADVQARHELNANEMIRQSAQPLAKTSAPTKRSAPPAALDDDGSCDNGSGARVATSTMPRKRFRSRIIDDDDDDTDSDDQNIKMNEKHNK
jgi:hypothetical protein